MPSFKNKFLAPKSLSHRYDTENLLGKMGRKMLATLNLEKMGDEVLDPMVKSLQLSSAQLIVMHEEEFIKISQIGSNQEVLKHCEALLHKAKGQLLQHCPDKPQPLLDRLNLTAVVPLIAQRRRIGLLTLTKNEGYLTDQDEEFLNLFSPELTIAVQNTINFKQISEFNKKLQDEVEQSTKQFKDASQEVYKMNLKLHELDKVKDEFISVTSHELRTPLTAIRGYLWMAMNSKKKDENYDLYMDRAYASTERLIGIVNDTLDISRIESGRVELTPEPVDMTKLVDEVVGELAPRASERSQTVKVERMKISAAWCDPNKVHQVLINIIGNALKFTPENGKVSINFKIAGKEVITSVSDTGPGISPEGQNRLFQKFSRLEATAAIQGTGLGLYLCKQIVELSGGKIWIESQVGKGSTFLFSLPISKVQPSILAPKEQAFKRRYATTT